MVNAVLSDRFDAAAKELREERPGKVLDRCWNAIKAGQEARAKREIISALQIYDDNALKSLGYDAEEIANIRKGYNAAA